LHVSGNLPQMLQMQIDEMLQKLKKLQLQLGEICNNGAIR
jgi:hypothetical protein